MEKENSQRSEEKKVNMKSRLIINVVTTVIFFVADLYVMINIPTYIPVLIIVTLLFIAAIVLTMDTIIKNTKEKDRQTSEVYENILKSEKASYLLLKKSFEELSSVLEMTDVKSEGATDKIIDAQKALAKVIINREKENADALMNSNDNVVEKVIFMERAMTELKPAILEEQRTHIKEANDKVVLKQEKLFIELNNMEASMRDGMNQVSERLSGFQEEIEKMADTLATMVSSVVTQTAASANVSISAPTAEEVISAPVEQPVMMEETTPQENQVEISVNDISASSADNIVSSDLMEEDEIKLEEILSIDDIVNSITEETSFADNQVESTDSSMDGIGLENIMASMEDDISLDNIGEIDNDISLDSIGEIDNDISLDSIGEIDNDISLDNITDDDSSFEDLANEIGILSDISLENGTAANNDINLEDLDFGSLDISANDLNIDSIEEANDTSLDDILKMTEEPVIKETDTADNNPNKIMTPDEIAALLAGASEPESKKEETIEAISIEEPKSGEPDLSNPNKIMTPDEIAALLANM